MGWEAHDRECGELAAQLLQRTVMREQCFKKPFVLHSDNGAPMKSVTLKAKMEELGMTGSHSRPRVSNNNPYSESLFRTMKYCPRWPSEGFNELDLCRTWVNGFVNGYNDKHCHSQIKFVTPAQRHNGEDKLILENRKAVDKDAKAKNPLRWSGKARNWAPIEAVQLNPEKEVKEAEKAVA